MANKLGFFSPTDDSRQAQHFEQYQSSDIKQHDPSFAHELLAGAASVDITPPPRLMMCGYAARTQRATGTHDPLTARALVIGDTAIVVADVLGVDAATSARIPRSVPKNRRAFARSRSARSRSSAPSWRPR